MWKKILILIHKAFNSDDELWCAMKEDDSGDDEEELDVFKMYFMYYVNLQRDKTFQSIIHIMNLAIEGGMDYDNAMDYAIQTIQNQKSCGSKETYLE